MCLTHYNHHSPSKFNLKICINQKSIKRLHLTIFKGKNIFVIVKLQAKGSQKINGLDMAFTDSDCFH